MQWEQTVYWYALFIFIIRQNAAFVKGFFAGIRGNFYAASGKTVTICTRNFISRVASSALTSPLASQSAF